MISKVSTRVRNNTKLGIDIPATYNESVEIDRINGNTYCQDTTKKEVKNVEVVFKCIDYRSRLLIRFNNTKRHLIFDVKFDLSKKPRYIGSGNLTQVSAFMSYSRVVSR